MGENLQSYIDFLIYFQSPQTGSSIFPLDLPIVSIKAYFEDYQDDIVILKITILLAMITVA